METVGRSALLQLFEAYQGCRACDALCASRTHVVFGEGSSSARIVVVGSHPGPEEDAVGAPFVGEAGNLLLSLFEQALPELPELDQIRALNDDAQFFAELREYLSDFIFWTNLVMCSPEEGSRLKAAEVKNCSDRLTRTLYAIDPLVIVAAGPAVGARLLGKKLTASSVGRFFDIEVTSPETGSPVRYSMFVLSDPATLVKIGDQHLVKRKNGETYKAIVALKYMLSILDKYTSTEGLPPTFPV